MKLLKIIIFLTSLFIVPNIFAKPVADEYYRDFWDPTYHLLRVNYCTADGKLCGRELADAYCKRRGYNRVVDERIAYNVGVTNYFGSKLQCKGCCNSFEYIRCAGNIKHKPPHVYWHRYKKFVDPVFDNERVDWCYQPGKGCGDKTAFSFCRRMGYAKASSYKKCEHLPRTRMIGSKKICNGNCRGFAEIICFR